MSRVLVKTVVPLVLILVGVTGAAYVVERLVGTRLEDSAEVLQRTGQLRLLASEVEGEVLVQDAATTQMLIDPELIGEVSVVKIAAYDRQQANMKQLEVIAPDERIRQLTNRIAEIDRTQLKPIDEKLLERMAAGDMLEARALYRDEYLPARTGYVALVSELEVRAGMLASDAEVQLQARTNETVNLLMAVFVVLGLSATLAYRLNRSRQVAVSTSSRLTRLVDVTQQVLAANDERSVEATLSAELNCAVTIDAARTTTSFEPMETTIALGGSAGALVAWVGAPTEEDRRFWQSLALTVGLHLASLETRKVIEKTAERLRASERDLANAHKLEAVGQLAAGIAHEINTPIQFVGDNLAFLGESMREIFGLVEDLQKHAPSKEVFARHPDVELDFLIPEIPQAIEQARDGVTRVAELVRGMKEFAHQDRGEIALTDLNRALERTITVARNEWKYCADLQTDFGEIPEVPCVGSSIRQVFLNLICNAAHAIADQNKATGRSRGIIKVTTRVEGDGVTVLISDTGAGMSKATKERLFEPFFTTKPVGQGSGQGLAISRSIVCERHSGKLEFESELGKGTTFHVHLPLAPPIKQAA